MLLLNELIINKDLITILNPSSSGSIYNVYCYNGMMYGHENIWGENLVITLPADALAPYGARPSAGTVLTRKSHKFPLKFLQLSAILRYLF